jgi:Uma2 family endonuclease
MITVPSENLRLPTAEELPDSDETPVDNQLQNDAPNLLLILLASIWASRNDWYFGVDMGIYYDPNQAAIVPDGFLAVGVPRHVSKRGRLSYVLWEERVIPILVLEVISEKYNREYETKLADYQTLEIPYYVVYNPLSGRRGRHKHRGRLEVYKLRAGKYELLDMEGHQIWLPEIELGLGYEEGEYTGWQREWLYWYDRQGQRYLHSGELVQQERIAKQQAELAKQQAEAIAQQERIAKQQAEAIAQQERQDKERLEAYLRSIGVNPEEIQ